MCLTVNYREIMNTGPGLVCDSKVDTRWARRPRADSSLGWPAHRPTNAGVGQRTFCSPCFFFIGLCNLSTILTWPPIRRSDFVAPKYSDVMRLTGHNNPLVLVISYIQSLVLYLYFLWLPYLTPRTYLTNFGGVFQWLSFAGNWSNMTIDGAKWKWIWHYPWIVIFDPACASGLNGFTLVHCYCKHSVLCTYVKCISTTLGTSGSTWLFIYKMLFHDMILCV